MNNAAIEKSTLNFLKNLSKNNDREWFLLHKGQYIKAQENVEHFMDALVAMMNVHDQLETPSGKKALYRIYSDVRFSKDKAPYNPRFAGYLRRVKPMLRGGYYIWIKPGSSRIGCGFSHPNADDLRRIRLDITRNHNEWNKILRSKLIRTNFGEMRGEQVKTAPRGFSVDDPAIDLLKFKQYWFEQSFTDKEVLSSDFLKNVNNSFKSIRPFFDYTSEVLTTDLNGESLF